MDPSYSGFVLDPSKCRKLSIQEKRDLIRELSKWPESAPAKLRTWSRRDLLEILCAEMGKERKYTGVTKQKLIEHLFRVVSDKQSGKLIEDIDPNLQQPPTNPQTPSKRQRKTAHPSRLPIETNKHLEDDGNEAPRNVRYCENLVCKATLSQENAFCKRCTCGICHKFDENKDPSLWLLCNTDYPFQGDACGISYHIECVLMHERAGIVKNGQCLRLDGSYYCIHCNKVNDLVACWRKQLMYAKESRRVDALCHRVSLSHKLLNSTEKYQSLHEIVDTAMRKLESEVGPLNGFPNMARGIVNRLPVGAEVQRLCAQAVELHDSMFLSGVLYRRESPVLSSSFIRFEDISSTSLTLVLGLEDNTLLPQERLGYTLYHRKADTKDYPTEPTCTLHKPKRKFIVTNLSPATDFIFRVIAFSSTRELGNWEIRATTVGPPKDVASGSPKTNSSGLSNPSPLEDESNNNSPDGSIGFQEKLEIKDVEKEETPMTSGSGLDEDPNSSIHECHRDSTNSTEHNQASDVPKSENESYTPIGNEMVAVTLPVPPSRLEANKPNPSCDLLEDCPSKAEKEPGSSSKKRSSGGNFEKNFTKDGSSSVEGDYEYCVKVIRWLECKGHIETSFRVKFLTWFSLRATPQERRIVSVYVDTLMDDPGSLAGQLVDTFSEAVCSKRPSPVPTGFCIKLWH